MSREEKYSGRTIRSVQLSFRLIEALQVQGGVGVSDLASKLGHSKSTIYSHLRTLEQENIVVQEESGYRLSLRMLDIANSVRNQFGNYEVVRKEVNKLANETGEIAQFGIEEYGKISYLHKSTGDQAVETASDIGKQQPLYSTALGKTILAHLSRQKMYEITSRIDYSKKTPNTITNTSDLHEELEQISERGYGVDDEENIEGLRCVAAPVKKGDTVFGAVGITGPSSRFTKQRIENSLSDKVKSTSNIIELNTKFS
ncbi:IclR family transcriptional regulator [Halalkalicoccus tibetensis]|uniref:IclR family transcriptional regulator n=1 Tax=Halalkalicoccus tibetensis TaxID=175632 RepID=A0ABD5VC92_9EURY